MTEIEAETANFTYARLMVSREDEEADSSGGEVFLYFISHAKVRNPAAAKAQIERVGQARLSGQRRRPARNLDLD